MVDIGGEARRSGEQGIRHWLKMSVANLESRALCSWFTKDFAVAYGGPWVYKPRVSGDLCLQPTRGNGSPVLQTCFANQATPVRFISFSRAEC